MSDTDDRLAIQDLIARYAVLVDQGRFDALDELFMPDARIDFSAFGGPVAELGPITEFLAATLPGFKATQHMMGLPAIELNGDTASARTSCNNPMVMEDREGNTHVWLIGLWYVDGFVRTPDGWRFSGRRQERCYTLTGFTDTPLGS